MALSILLVADDNVGKSTWLESLKGLDSICNYNRINQRYVFDLRTNLGEIGINIRTDSNPNGEYDILMVLYDVTSKKSFYQTCAMIDTVPLDRTVVLIGNKIDLPNRAISSRIAQINAELLGVKHFEMSAKSGRGALDPIPYAVSASFRLI